MNRLKKNFLNSVSISQRYSITKFETFDSGVCMTQRVKNFRLGKSKTILQIFSFMTDVFTLKEFLLIVPLKATRNSQRFWFWLIGVQFDSAVWCTPQSLTQQWDAHRGAWLSSRKHTAELDSVVWCTPRSFLKILNISAKSKLNSKILQPVYQGPRSVRIMKKKLRSKILRHTPFKCHTGNLPRFHNIWYRLCPFDFSLGSPTLQMFHCWLSEKELKVNWQRFFEKTQHSLMKPFVKSLTNIII